MSESEPPFTGLVKTRQTLSLNTKSPNDSANRQLPGIPFLIDRTEQFLGDGFIVFRESTMSNNRVSNRERRRTVRVIFKSASSVYT